MSKDERYRQKRKSIQAYLDARKLTMDEFYNDPKKSEIVF
jgi:hypothetical protein